VRVPYIDAFSLIQCDAAEIDAQTCQNHDSLGETATLARENDERCERASSCILVRVVDAYERCMMGAASMRVCGVRDAIPNSVQTSIDQA
jgi:hypothetical protein